MAKKDGSRTRPAARRRSEPSVRAPARAVAATLDALELLASSETPLGVTEVAERLGTSTPAAHRMLAALRDRGYAEQDPETARYAIGLRAFGLATLSASRQDLQQRAGPHARELNEESGETVHLALYDRGWVVYLQRLESRKPVGPIGRVGARAPAHCVATGRAILAYLPVSEIDALVAAGLERYTDDTPTTRQEIEEVLEQTRRAGWALNHGAYRESVSGVAAPVRDWTGRVVASLGCCLPTRRLTRETEPGIIEQTVLAAGRLSADLGFVTPAPSAPESSSG